MAGIGPRQKKNSNDNKATTTAAATVATVWMDSSSSSSQESLIDYDKYLSEDVLFEILLHLPVKSIFKFRCVSKLWLSLLSNPLFLTRKLNRLTPSPWAIFYGLPSSIEEWAEESHSIIPASQDLIHSQFICDHDVISLKFLLPNICLEDYEHLYLEATSNGLVLCSIMNENDYVISYYVCNPLTKKWVSLPPPPKQSHGAWFLHGFISQSSSSPMTPTSYKVLRIPQFNDDPSTEFVVEMFSSDLGEWNTYQVSCPQHVSWHYKFESNLVIHNEVSYWIEERNRIIAYKLTNDGGHQCWLIDLPPSIDDARKYGRLGQSEGLISYSRCENGELSVWVLEGNNSTSKKWAWSLVHNIKTKDMLLAESCNDAMFIDKLASGENLEPLAFNPVDRNILILCYPSWFTFAYNIRTRLVEVLLDSYHEYLKDEELFPTLVMTPMPTTIPLSPP